MIPNDLIIWNLTLLRPPPVGVWFFGKYPNDEVMPTVLHNGNCISVRLTENGMDVCNHKGTLPYEWRT